MGAQVVVQGKRLTTTRARDYAALKPALMGAVLDSFKRLCARHDLVIVEGAGSPAEVNLRQGDIANMGFAEAAHVPVVLCGDIDRGGVIAQIVGTQAVMPAADADRIKGFIINKFRGDPALFDDGYAAIAQMTGWRGYGVAPWFADAWRLPAEDALDIADTPRREGFHIVCLRLSRIANFDDLDPLSQEANVRVTMLPPGQPIPADADLVILPGSKSTRGDLAFLRAGLGHRSERTSQARWPRSGDLRRISDAGQLRLRPHGHRGHSRRHAGSWPLGYTDRYGR